MAPATTRKTNLLKDLTTVEAGYSLTQAMAEADRCLLCFDAPCSQGCPAGTDPGAFIRKLHLKNITGAVRTVKENNPLGGICGTICPVARLCEEKCSNTEISSTINIGRIQRFLVEYGWQTGFNPIAKPKSHGTRVAVVGSGPAGLACAAFLARAGYAVTIFEAARKPGGVVRSGVPAFRLSEATVAREIEDIRRLGVTIKCNTRLAGKGAIEKLLKRGFKAVFVGAGLAQPYRLRVPGMELANVLTATEFLPAAKADRGKAVRGLVRGKRVAIIGGGSVAMDVAATCAALGAKKVYCLALESMRELPADQHDLRMAIDNGVIIRPQCQVTAITGTAGKVSGLTGTETEWRTPGLLVPANAKTVPGTEFGLKVEAVITAIGSGPDPKLRELLPRVKFTPRGLIVTDQKTQATSVRGIYAGGDLVRGPALVVEAVADGKRAAESIIKSVRR